MVLARWQATIVDEQGDVQPTASVEVRREITGAPLVPLYSDRAGVTPLGNPFTADTDGLAAFHAAGGAYRITATKGGFSRVWRYVGIGTSQETDVSEAANVTGPSGGVLAGQLAVFGDTSGNVIEGGEDGSSPPQAVTLADILDASALPDAGETQRGVVEMATDAEIRSAAAGAKAVMAEDLETASALVSITNQTPATWDWDDGINRSLTISQNTQIANPTNGQPGTWRTITVQGNDGTDRTITFGNQFLGELPTITDCDSAKWYDLYIRCITSTHFSVSAKVVKS